MHVQAVLLCVASLIVVQYGATVREEIRPVVETDLELKAADSDAGNWTAKVGNMEVNIEHKHDNTMVNSSGTWTLDIARTVYDEVVKTPEENKEENRLPEENKEENFNFIIPHTSETFAEYGTEESMQDHTAIPLDDISTGPPVSDSFEPQYQIGIRPQQIYGPYQLPQMLIPPPLFQGGDAKDTSDEVVLDPDNFEYFSGVGWFKLDNRHLNWEAASQACAEIGAHLAVPDTKERAQVFLKLFRRHPEIPANAILRQQVYVGVHDPEMKRKFTTVQGKPFNPGFPIWFLNEPDNAPPGESCVTFHTEGRTRDVPCFYALPFFCEKDLPNYIE